MYLISKLLIKMKFDSQHTRKCANQFLGLAYSLLLQKVSQGGIPSSSPTVFFYQLPPTGLEDK